MSPRTTKIFLFLILFGLLFIPRIQKRFKLIYESPLEGEFIPAEKANFSYDAWFEGIFQKNYNTYYEENIGLRNSLIRIYDQVDFSFFNTTHGDVVMGKHGNLFLKSYLNSYIGADYIGREKIDSTVQKISAAISFLRKKGIFTLIVFAPTKVRTCSEFIPAYYAAYKTDSNNYSAYKKEFKEAGIEHIDFIDYFQNIKHKSSYALYPERGIHWSQYGVYLATDSILHFLKDRGFHLNDILCDTIGVSSKLESTDYDLGSLSNVLFTMPHDPMPYPVTRYTNYPDRQRPNVLVIGDSYYWNIYHTDFPESIFNGRNFWYYNHEVNTDSLERKPEKYPFAEIDTSDDGQLIYFPPLNPNLNRFISRPELFKADTNRLLNIYHSETVRRFSRNIRKWDLQREGRSPAPIKRYLSDYEIMPALSKQQILIIMQTEPNLNKLGFGLFEFIYSKINEPVELIEAFEQAIRNNPPWVESIRKKATQNNVDLDAMIRADAEWLAHEELKKNK